MLDLKIKGRKAIVCAASKGLGRACAMSLGRAGVDLVITARTKETLEATAEEIRKETGAKVTAIAGDIGTEAGRQASEAYRAATDDIIAETFAGWTSADLRVLAGLLERVAEDFTRPVAERKALRSRLAR